MGFKIETTKKRAEIFCSDKSRLNGNFFVALRAPGRDGNELVLDLLVSEKTYLPFELDDGHIVLLQKKCIMMVVLEDRDLKENISYEQQIPADVCFLSGESIKGNVYSDLPKSHARLSDFLNHSKAFFYIEVDEKDYLVNSRLVKIVRPIPP
jgi:hypothetical protein